nr:MAG TPA: activated protein kinase C receptor [Caudoviricetes sp.]
MEPIKIELQVSLNLSDETMKFFEHIITGIAATAAIARGCTTTIMQATEPAKSAAEPAKSAAKPAAEPVAEPAKPAAEPAKPAAETKEYSIDDVRKLLVTKINNHRPEIKDKLSELGAPSVTKLDQSKYSDFISFLNSLS